MQGYTKCGKGHFYKETLPNCPYCPEGKSSPASGGDMNKTIVGGGAAPTEVDPSKTEVYSSQANTEKVSGGGFSGDRTQIFTPGGSNNNPSSNAPSPAPSNKNVQFDRTFIGGMPPASTSEGDVGGKPAAEPRAARKIVGWIISYTIDPMGVDYRIFEGNNTIGRDPINTIKLLKDSTISSKHATILYRAGKFWVKDEMSANGSFLNGEEMEIQKAYQLNDNDDLRLGDTAFKFKSAE